MGESRQFRNPITGWWDKQPEPRWVTPLIAGFYLSCFLAGFSVLVDEPLFLNLGLGDLLTAWWGVLCVSGGLLGAWAAVTGWFVAERGALIAVGCAVSLYIATLIDLQMTVEQNLTWRAFLDVGLLFMILIRWFRVRHGLRDPEHYSTYRPDPSV